MNKHVLPVLASAAGIGGAHVGYEGAIRFGVWVYSKFKRSKTQQPAQQQATP